MDPFRIAVVGPGLAGRTCAAAGAMGVDPRDLYFQDESPSFFARGGSCQALFSFLRRLFGPVVYTPDRPEVANDLLRLRRCRAAWFVADSQRERLEANVGALSDLRAALQFLGRRSDDLPLVFLLNKRDLPSAMPEAELETALPWPGAAYFPTIASQRIGVGLALDHVLAT